MRIQNATITLRFVLLFDCLMFQQRRIILVLIRVYQIGYYISIILPLLLVPSWALAIDPFLSPPADGLSLVTLIALSADLHPHTDHGRPQALGILKLIVIIIATILIIIIQVMIISKLCSHYE